MYFFTDVLFFTQSERIEPVSPKAAQLGVSFLPQHTVRDARKRILYSKIGKEKKPSTRQDSNPRLADYEASALLLCPLLTYDCNLPVSRSCAL